jgi:hypothetical protein
MLGSEFGPISISGYDLDDSSVILAPSHFNFWVYLLASAASSPGVRIRRRHVEEVDRCVVSEWSAVFKSGGGRGRGRGPQLRV